MLVQADCFIRISDWYFDLFTVARYSGTSKGFMQNTASTTYASDH